MCKWLSRFSREQTKSKDFNRRYWGLFSLGGGAVETWNRHNYKLEFLVGLYFSKWDIFPGICNMSMDLYNIYSESYHICISKLDISSKLQMIDAANYKDSSSDASEPNLPNLPKTCPPPHFFLFLSCITKQWVTPLVNHFPQKDKEILLESSPPSCLSLPVSK